ncbi:hypothetical protein [Helicobacter felis]|uniref:Uncharacterized protein n=1 Tax=Helicobacter felis (strain ATCC 49179 / CCUG 28539 / NCTC 12436 / CS1) TaxID=936155 RepID=E7A8S9_HELFC|nr:hypothetical protein [Helicobacter felis]CBY83210.1 putative uncharacterized protein [Helicobacter felis ATCC 49179]
MGSKILALCLSVICLYAQRLPTGDELLREEKKPPVIPFKASIYLENPSYVFWTQQYGVRRAKRILEIEAITDKVRVESVTLNEGRCSFLPILPSYTLMLHEKMRYEVFCDETLRVEIKSNFGTQILHPDFEPPS